jgi:hypothetical protein
MLTVFSGSFSKQCKVGCWEPLENETVEKPSVHLYWRRQFWELFTERKCFIANEI